MLKVVEIAFTGYPVTDMPRARAFYEQVLNLTPATVFDHEGKQWVEYEIGPHVIGISNMAGEQWKPSADGPSAALEVEDYDQAIEHLKANGARFVIESMDTGVCRMAIISDPDGNSIAIHKRHAH